MLKKLLKYDVRSVWKLWVALSATVLGMALITSLIIRATLELSLRDSHSLSFVFSTFGSITSGIMMVLSWSAMLLVVPLMCYIRYYKNFFSDEGYLTFTLPVKRSTLYLSKVVNVFLFSMANIVTTILAVLIMMLVIPVAEDGHLVNFAAFDALKEMIGWLWDAFHGWTLAYALELLALMAVATLCQIGMIHLCITVGATLAKKHKVLAGVGLYFGAHFAVSSVSQVLNLFTVDGIIGFFSLLADSRETIIHIALLVLLLAACVAVSVVALILHLLAIDTIERKLNLA